LDGGGVGILIEIGVSHILMDEGLKMEAVEILAFGRGQASIDSANGGLVIIARDSSFVQEEGDDM
jgi:hypothetical protein